MIYAIIVLIYLCPLLDDCLPRVVPGVVVVVVKVYSPVSTHSCAGLSPSKDLAEGAEENCVEQLPALMTVCLLLLLLLWVLQPAPAPGSPVLGDELRPHFDSHLPSQQTVQQGDTAYLHCRIFTAQNMSVSVIMIA